MIGFTNPLFARGDPPVPPVAINPADLFTAGYSGALFNPAAPGAQWQGSDGTGAAAANDPVGRASDLSGLGNHAIQAAAGLRPLLKQSGGTWWYETDGIDDALRAALALTTPFDLILGLRMLSLPGNSHVLGGPTLGCAGTTLYMYSGSSGQPSAAISAGVDYVVTCRFDGAASRMRVDRGTYAAGSPGSELGSALCIGNYHSGAGSPTNIRLHGLFCRSGGAVLSANEVVQVEDWCAARQGRTL